jgi:hypothetical protein
MISADEAKKKVEEVVDCTVEACVPYKGGFLARVKFNSPEEEHYDPFFMINAHNGAVAEFSIMTDGDPREIAAAFEQEDHEAS